MAVTSRRVPEWQGRNPDSAIPPRVKARIVAQQHGVCACGCGVKLGLSGEIVEVDHIQPLILGGENRESNLQALRSRCHKAKTREDVAQKSTEARKRNKALGFKPRRALIPGSKGSGWRRKMDGTVVRVKE